MKIAQISDTHFGTEIPEVVKALEASLQIIKPDFILLSGDVTQRARKSQFIKAREFLEGTRLPFKVIPGNHDIPLFDLLTRFTNPYRLYQQFFGARGFVYVESHIAVIGLDATGPERHKQGKLDPEHISALLTSARQKVGSEGFLIVSVHQPLLTAWTEDRPEEMIDAGLIAQIFARFHVDAVLSGHVHVPLICTSEKEYPNLPYPFIHVGAGTATSHRTREGKPNSFDVIELNQHEQRIQVTQFDYQEQSKAFALKEEKVFLKSTASKWQLR